MSYKRFGLKYFLWVEVETPANTNKENSVGSQICNVIIMYKAINLSFSCQSNIVVYRWTDRGIIIISYCNMLLLSYIK